MRRLLAILAFMIAGLAHGHAATVNCDIPAGSSESTVLGVAAQASVGNCTVAPPKVPDGKTVYLEPGTYPWTTQGSLPCGTVKWTITGPVVQPTLQTIGGRQYLTLAPLVHVVGSFAGNQLLTYPTCTTGFVNSYIEWDGNHPSGGGGGFLYAGFGSSNYTVDHNYIHGFQGTAGSAPGESQAFIFMDGNALNNTSSPSVASNVTVTNNWVGATNGSDCGPYMEEYQYVPNNSPSGSYGDAGGYCGTLGRHSYTTNMVVKNNVWFHIEQAEKCYAADGSPPYYQFFQNNFVFQYNYLTQNHRIPSEGQCQANTTETYDSNVIDAHYYGGYGTWCFSKPQSGGGGGTGGFTNITNNVCIADVVVPNVATTVANCGVSPTTSCYAHPTIGGFGYAPAFEFWGPGLLSHNLTQGRYGSLTNSGGMAAYGCEIGPGTISYNTSQFLTNSPYITGPEQCSGATPPTQTGNSFLTTTPTAIASVAPSISPAPSGSYSSPITVTLTSNGYTGSTTPLPLGNTSAYYTIDGSTPTVSSTFCGYSCTITVPQGTTVKTLSMYGAHNQPTSYVSGYGFTPSGVVSATYPSSGGTPTAATPAFTPPTENFSGTITVTAASSTPSSSLFCTTDGSTPTPSSTPYPGGGFSVSATTTIKCVATASGFLTSAAGTGVYTLSAVTLTSMTQTCFTSTVPVTGTSQCAVQCFYSNSTNDVCTNGDGLSTPTYSPTSGLIATISSSALVTGVSAGSVNVFATVGGVNSNLVPITVQPAPVTAKTVGRRANFPR